MSVVYSAGSNKYHYDYTVLQIDWKTRKGSHCEACGKDIPVGDDVHVFKPGVRFLGFEHRCTGCASKDASFKPRERLVFDPETANWTRQPI